MRFQSKTSVFKFLGSSVEKASNFLSLCKRGHNLVPRAHVSFGQRQDTELLNNQFPDSKILGISVSRCMPALVYNMAPRNKVDMDA